MSFAHMQTDTEDAQIAAVGSIAQTAQAVHYDFETGGDQFQKQEHNREGQAVEFGYRALVSTFQVKAVGFTVDEHFLNLHMSFIGMQRFAKQQQVGDQQPGYLLRSSVKEFDDQYDFPPSMNLIPFRDSSRSGYADHLLFRNCQVARSQFII